MHRSHATLYPLMLGKSIASLLLLISKLPPLKRAVLREKDISLREEAMNLVKPALVWNEMRTRSA